eukprot:COSAG05_NODE_3086_length_2335_cov_258.283989_3_plen_162_part_00
MVPSLVRAQIVSRIGLDEDAADSETSPRAGHYEYTDIGGVEAVLHPSGGGGGGGGGGAEVNGSHLPAGGSGISPELLLQEIGSAIVQFDHITDERMLAGLRGDASGGGRTESQQAAAVAPLSPFLGQIRARLGERLLTLSRRCVLLSKYFLQAFESVLIAI